MNKTIASRIKPLDWLRGIMAMAIMLYHLTSWHVAPLDSSSLLGRLGIYGVSIFFVLSGLSMAVANEMVYYALTPFILISYERNKALGNVLLILTCLVAVLFAFWFLDSKETLANQWETYINPFNNMFLYVAGIAIYYNLKNVDIGSNSVLILLSIALLAFLFYPAAGDRISIATGVNRVVFSTASIVLVCAFYKFSQQSVIPKCIQNLLEILGVATYGVYLIHPVVDSYVALAMEKMGFENTTSLFILVVALTVPLAIVSFNVFERRAMKYGKDITSNGSPLWAVLDYVGTTKRSSGC